MAELTEQQKLEIHNKLYQAGKGMIPVQELTYAASQLCKDNSETNQVEVLRNLKDFSTPGIGSINTTGAIAAEALRDACDRNQNPIRAMIETNAIQTPSPIVFSAPNNFPYIGNTVNGTIDQLKSQGCYLNVDESGEVTGVKYTFARDFNNPAIPVQIKNAAFWGLRCQISTTPNANTYKDYVCTIYITGGTVEDGSEVTYTVISAKYNDVLQVEQIPTANGMSFKLTYKNLAADSSDRGLNDFITVISESSVYHTKSAASTCVRFGSWSNNWHPTSNGGMRITTLMSSSGYYLTFGGKDFNNDTSGEEGYLSDKNVFSNPILGMYIDGFDIYVSGTHSFGSNYDKTTKNAYSLLSYLNENDEVVILAEPCSANPYANKDAVITGINTNNNFRKLFDSASYKSQYNQMVKDGRTGANVEYTFHMDIPKEKNVKRFNFTHQYQENICVGSIFYGGLIAYCLPHYAFDYDTLTI